MNESDLLNKMADIELPAPPDWQPLIITVSAVMLIAVATILIIRHISKSGKNPDDSPPVNVRHSSVVFEDLKEQWSKGRITDREASYRLSTLLRLSLGLQQLDTACPPGLTNDAGTWENTIQLFNQLRYKQNTQATLSPDVFNHIKKWLMHASSDGQRAC